MSVCMAPVHTRLSQSFLSGVAAKITNPILGGFIHFYKAIGVLRVNNDPEKTVNQRGRVFWQEAIRRGVPMCSFLAFGRPVDLYMIELKGKKIYFNGLPRPIHTPNNSEWWMDDKFTLKQVLQKAGVPVACGGVFSSYEPLLQQFLKLDKPVIIKPRLGSRGRHTTTFIYTELDLKKAFVSAKQLCHWVILEEHLIGSVYRATMIGGKLAGVLAGDPPRVTGDGVSTIGQLIVKKNNHKPKGVKDVVITPQHITFLARQEYTLDTVLSEQKTIDLLEKIGVSYGGSSGEVTEITHPEIKNILEKAAAAVGDPLIGFDFIIKDITIDPYQQKWGVIECNGLPFINLHYDPIEGKTNNVAQPLWDYIEQHSAAY